MEAVEAACREHWGRLLALLVARYRDLTLAEDALADAVEAAVRTWPVDGTPREPAAWLLTVARRRATDRLRGADATRRHTRLLAVDQVIAGRALSAPVEDAALDALADAELPDERLRLILLCCHPALAPEAQAALALRLVVGVPTGEVARLFLVSEATMAARITRAKKRIVASRIPFALPDADRLPERVESALRAIYLAFTAGYAPGQGTDVLQADLAGEAVRLARVLAGLVPADAAARALLALLLLQHARRDARVDAAGDLVLLPDQDRTRWHRDEIAEGLALLRGVHPQTPYAADLTLQAQIAALHTTASTAERTDWAAIAERYRLLEELTGSPVVRLNRAVAVAEAVDADAGLALLEGLDDHLPTSHRLPAVRAELLARAGRTAEAAASLDLTIERCANDAERRYLLTRRARLA